MREKERKGQNVSKANILFLGDQSFCVYFPLFFFSGGDGGGRVHTPMGGTNINGLTNFNKSLIGQKDSELYFDW